MEKVKKYFPYIYVLFLVFSFLYVRSALKEGEIREFDDTEETKKPAVPVKVSLEVDGNIYSARLESDDTVLDLLEDLRDDGKINFEKTEYVYGTEIDTFNGVKPSSGYKWKVYSNNTDVTNIIGDVALTNDSTYVIRLEKEKRD